MATPLQIVDLLEEALEADPDAMHMLVESRVACSQAMVEHPTIVVSTIEDQPVVGLLGIINGIVGRDGSVIEAVYDADRRLVGFRLQVPVA